MTEKREQKRKQIKDFRSKGKTYKQIAKIMGVTHQRIQQVYSDGKYNSTCKKVILVCAVCKKKILLTPSVLKQRKFCSRECLRHGKYATEEERQQARRQMQKGYMKKYHAKLKQRSLVKNN